MCPILSVLQALQSAPEETHGAERAGQRAELCAYRCEDSGRLLSLLLPDGSKPILVPSVKCWSACPLPCANLLLRSSLAPREILALRQVGMMPQRQQQAAWCWFVSGMNLVRPLYWDRVRLASLPASAKARLLSCCSEFGIPYPTAPDPLDRLSAGWFLAVPSIQIPAMGTEG